VGPGVRLRPPDWRALERAIAGELVLPGAPGYDAARRPAIANFAGVRPQAVVRCATAADVAETLAFARSFGVHVVPRSGGHCVAGRSSTEGIVVDVRPMRTVSVSDRVATIGAGARLGELYDALDEHGLTIPAGCGPTVGIAGLTLGGGAGLLGRRYGLTCDRLRAARVVLADGRVVDCDPDHDRELFWALRGAGGGHFGVVTALVFDAVRATMVTAFRLTWPLAAAGAVIAAWQDWAPDGPDELHASLQLADAVTVVGVMLEGQPRTAELLDELVSRTGVDPAAASHEHVPYRDAKRSLADEDGEPSHRYGRSEFFNRSLPTDAIAALVATFAQAPASRELNFIPWGGAYNRVAPDATAFVHRRERFLIEHVASEPTPWIGRSWACVHPWGSGRVYPNFPEPDLDDWAEAYYASNLARLLRVKRSYDSESLFASFPQSLG
jgi:FAD/FMN-containing dehydrogenase